MSTEPGRLGKAAIGCGSKGWRVFPVRPGQKEPQIAQWQLAATANPDRVRRWWQQWPDANIGLATGQHTGIVVLDIDPRHGGFDSWNDLIDLHGPVDSLEAYTGGGGTHIYFQAPAEPLRNSAGGIAPGIDTRAEGGYVLLPPSIHPSGEAYEWITRKAPAELPPWLLERWPRHQSGPTDRASRGSPAGGSHAWQLLNQPIAEGARNDSLTRIAGWLRLYHPEHVVEALLLAINDARCSPPLPADEVGRIVKSVFHYPQPGVNGHPLAVVPIFYRESSS